MSKKIDIEKEFIKAFNEAKNEASTHSDIEFLNSEQNIANINDSINHYKTTLAKDLLNKKPDIINEIVTKNIEYNKMKNSFLYKIKKFLNLI